MFYDKVFIIAEAGSNWRCGTRSRDMKMARTLIDVAVEAGADAVKFQTYRGRPTIQNPPKRKADKALNLKRRDIFGGESNCETTSAQLNILRLFQL